MFSPAVFGIMANLPAFEASSFLHALGTFLGGKFLESYRINVHGVGVMGGSGGWNILNSKAWVVSASS